MGTLLANHNVFFNYGTEPVEIGHKIVVKNGEKVKQPVVKEKKYTECIISSLDGETISEGKVRRYHKDKDVKLEGRYQAFRKAVHKINDKPTRDLLRQEYKINMKLPEERKLPISFVENILEVVE
jgi:hypothetical protein